MVVVISLTAPVSLTAYASPEQLRGENLDARSDVFAFGAVFYEMLSGRRAFVAHDPEELRTEILEGEPAPLQEVPDEIQRLLSRCLRKKREQRWQRMNSILIELKLANAISRQVQQASEWKERIDGMRTQIAGVDGKVTAHRVAQEAVIAELRQTIRQLEEQNAEYSAQFARVQEALAPIRETVAGLQKGSQIQTRTIESLEAAIAQTDEVVEHIVDAFGLTQKPMVERAEAAKISRNGS